MAGFMLSSLIHLELSFVHGDIHGSICSLLHHPIVPAPFVEDAFLSSLYFFICFVENQVFVGVWINIGIFDSIPLVYLSIFVPRPGCFQNYSSVVELKGRDGDAS